MKMLVIMRRVMGVEVWQVYSAQGFHGQRWSQGYAEQLAARIQKELTA